MRIFVAGATGALGKQLVPQLVAAGHEVTGMTRSESKAGMLREMGAEPVVADALDAEAVGAAVAAARPEVVINELTAISDDPDFRKPDEEFAETNRLRTEGTDILLSAALAAGAGATSGRASPAGRSARRRPRSRTRSAPMRTDPPEGGGSTRSTRSATSSPPSPGAEGIEGVVLRYGGFYGPGTILAADPDASMIETVRKRQMPLVGKGDRGVVVHPHRRRRVRHRRRRRTRGARHLQRERRRARPGHGVAPVLAETLDAKKPMRDPGVRRADRRRPRGRSR